MPDNRSDDAINCRLRGLSAILTHLRGETEVALAQLEGKSDPDSIRRKLDILLNTKRYAEAAETVRLLAPEKRWCDLGVFALARQGNLTRAHLILEWSKRDADRSTWRRCLLMYGKARYLTALERLGADQPILPVDLSADELSALRDALSSLEPTLQVVVGNEKIDSALEAETVQIALHAAALTGDHAKSIRLAEVLKTRTPVPLALPRFIEEHIVATPKDLPYRLRTEHPDSFGAEAAAIILEAHEETTRQQAYQGAKDLLATGTTEDEREFALKLLNEIAQRLGPEVLAEVDDQISTVLPESNRFRQLTVVDRLIRRRDLDAAFEMLQRLKDERDPFWLQLYANYRLQLGDGRSASDYFAQASKVFPHPQILRNAALIALDVGRLVVAQGVLEGLLSREPTAIPELKQLAFVYVQLKLSVKAAETFAKLQLLEPTDLAHSNNLALSLWQAGELDKALETLNSLVDKLKLVPISLVLSKADLLKDLNRPLDTFAWLLRYKQAHWDDYRYVQTLMHAGFAAEREDIAHEAMMHLEKLQGESKAPAEILQRKTLEDLKGFIQKHREASDFTSNLLLENKIPWLFADKGNRRPTYLAWTFRTQPLNWLSDDAVERSQFTIYSTNGFFVRQLGAPDAMLTEIVAPTMGTSVVVDLSALITLAELELLPEAFGYFGEIKIPAVYISASISELARLQSHQPSRRSALREIHDAVRNKSLKVVESLGSPESRPYPYIHEHTLDEENAEHYYRLIDAVNVADSAGLLSEDSRRKLCAVAHKQSGVDEGHPKLAVGTDVLIDLSSLMTICQVGAFPSIAKVLRLHLAAPAQREIDNELAAFQQQEQIFNRHSRLWDFIRKDPRVKQMPLELPPELEDRSDETTVAIISNLLAEEQQLPLYADDRVLQTITLNAHSKESTPAFGTDALLSQLLAAGRISKERHLQCLMRLVEWRYRFLVPEPEALVELAFEFATHPPGDRLIAVARYFHDCMNDPGILAGFEATNPPVSIAARLFMTLTTKVTEFLIDVWSDERFSVDAAKMIAKWALTEMLPTPVRKMGTQGSLLASLSKRLVISRALIRACAKQDVERACAGIMAIAEGMEIPEDEFWRLVTEVIGAKY